MTDLHTKLAARLGPKGYSTDAEIIAPHLKEWRGRFQGEAPFMAMPSSAEEVSAVVRLCAEAGAAITPQGGNTGLVGAQIPQGEILLSMKRMNRIRDIDADDDALVAEAGVVLKNVQDAAAKADRLFPLSLASEGSATIGGLISTNAGGVHVLRYGMMRDLVFGLEAVLPDGRIWSSLKRLRKDNTGYDLKQLFIGAEGTLGVVTAASLKLYPRPRSRVTALAAPPTAEAALALLHRVKAETGAVSAFELMDRMSVALTAKNVKGQRDPMPGAAFIALIEFEAAFAEGLRERVEETLAAAIEACETADALIAENEGQAHSFWKLREDLSSGHRAEGVQVNHDISVPVSRIPAFLPLAQAAADKILPGARIVAFGHMGDGNLHYSVLAPEGFDPALFPREMLNSAINEIVVALDGSISAEHGIGVARLADFNRFKDPSALALMRLIKAAFDPRGVMNPRALIG
ncbi:MAG TPA: FAD-binding oxidoreductase [Caulobacterales bacterium]|nr:FAD-binding oxidoreductase [Caulobacterales bacterium]